MMQIQENQKKKDQDKKNTGALNTEEILSLLSKTSQDFKKESEITENISYLFNKKTPKDLALSSQSVFVYGILKRGSTQIGEADGASNRLRPTFQSFNANEGVVEHQNFTFLDSPNTTSATTYKFQFLNSAGTTSYINRSQNGTQPSPSSITVMEVAA